MNNAVLIAAIAGAALIAVSAIATYIQTRNDK